MTNINQTLGVIPQMPTIAQQFNFGSKDKKSELKPIDIQIEFKK